MQNLINNGDSKMKPASAGSASPARPARWSQLDWQLIRSQVRGLQTRIAKAAREQDWRRVKALQRFLVNSFSAKALAVRRVTESDGKRTPGIDGETWKTPAARWQAIQRLSRRGYKPQPLRRIYIPKANGKMRPLGIPIMRDRAMQALYLLALEPVSETHADPNSYGFRKGRSTHDAMQQLFGVLARKTSAQWVLEGDIKGCFDNISHDWLERNVCMDKAVLRSWLKAGYVESKKLFPTEAGTPQGGVISPTLANIALDQLERALTKHFVPTETLMIRLKVRLVRYADDFVITGCSKELLENEVKPFVETFLGERGLQLSQEKTKVTHINEGFDFLGLNLRKYKGKLLIKPSKKNVKTFLDRIRKTIRGNLDAETGNLIGLLNPMIRGWANYHRHYVAKVIFTRVDAYIWHTIWRWAKRRHPKKSSQWVRRRYFRSIGSRNWVFAAKAAGRIGEPRLLTLYKAADTPIVRHTKIKSAANPFDPAWDLYFAGRTYSRMRIRLDQGSFLKNLWSHHNGLCSVCRRLVDDNDPWHVHRIVPRNGKAPGKLSDFVILHTHCKPRARLRRGKANPHHHHSTTGSSAEGSNQA